MLTFKTLWYLVRSIFIYLFLPVVLLLYLIAGNYLRNTVMLLASLVFYAWGGVSYTSLIIISILINYFFGLLIGIKPGERKSKIFLILGIILNLSMLSVFKYGGFIIHNINVLFNLIGLQLNIENPGIILPIGISFIHSRRYRI